MAFAVFRTQALQASIGSAHAQRRWLSSQSIPILSHEWYKPTTNKLHPPVAPLVILHGLFGSKQNWRSLSKSLANRLGTDVIPLDLRNHGDSPHHDKHDYPCMAADIDDFLQRNRLDKINLVGHSMGGKVAMHYALSHPTRLDKLVVVDISPTDRDLSSEFGSYIAAMRNVEQARVKNKDEADKLLARTIESLSIRQFLLTNLKKFPGEDSMRFRINVPVLERSLQDLWRFPYEGSGKTYNGPALFIAGKKSRYITPSKHPIIKKFFPNAEIQELDAGHWVHAERPEEFQSLVTSFLTR